MNNNLKVIFGTIAGVMIGGLTVVGANQAIQAIHNTEIKVSLNGQIQEFRDETTGEIQYPLTYHDRTYLPLRNIAQLSGLSVDYDNNSKTAILKDENQIDFSYLEKYYNENDCRIKMIDDGYNDLERFNRKIRYYLNKSGTTLTIDASSYDLPNNKIVCNLTGFYGSVRSCVAIYNRKVQLGNLQNLLIVALSDSGQVFVLAPLSNSFSPLIFSYEYGNTPVEGIGIYNKEILEYSFTSDNYDTGTFNAVYGPKVCFKDAFDNVILLNTFRNEGENLKNDNELHITVKNSYEPLYSDIVNNIQTAEKFYIRDISYNNEEVLADQIQKIEYWFDNEKPKEISVTDSIPEVYLRSPYNQLNIKVIYNNKDYNFSYKISPKSYEVAGFVEDCIKEGDYYTCKINGVKYEGITNDVENNSFVFLVEMNRSGRFIALGNLKGSNINYGRTITKVTDDSFEATDTGINKTTAYIKEELYTRCSIMNYIEVDSNNNIVNHEIAFSRNHPNFTLQVGDVITSESANLGLFNVYRRVESASTEQFFTYNDNTEILVTRIPDILYEDSEIDFTLSDYLKNNEKLNVKCTYDGKTVDIYNNNYDKKTYVLYAKQIQEALKKSYRDLNGSEIKIEAVICDSDKQIINNCSFTTYIGIEEPVEITTNFDSIKNDSSKIIITFNREIKDYEELKIEFLLKTSNDNSGRFIRPELKKLSNGNIEVDVAELKQKTFDILNNKSIYNIVKDGNDVKAYNILDEDSKDYIIDLNEVEIKLNVEVMQYQRYGIGSKGGNDVGRIVSSNKVSLMDFFKG